MLRFNVIQPSEPVVLGNLTPERRTIDGYSLTAVRCITRSRQLAIALNMPDAVWSTPVTPARLKKSGAMPQVPMS